MHELPVEADHVDEQPLGEPVLAHHPGRQARALVGELEVPVALDGEQAVALHPGHRLADRRAALVQPLGDPGAQRDDALLLQLVDGPEVHLGGVDQVAHRGHSVPSARWRRCRRRWQSGRRAHDSRDVVPPRPAPRRQPGPARRRATVTATCCRCSCSTRRCGARPGPSRAGLPRRVAARARRLAPAAPAGLVRRTRRPGARGGAGRAARSARAGCTSPPTSAPTATRATREVEQALAEHGIELVRTGSPYAVAPGRVTQRRRRRPTRSSRRSPRAWAGARLARRRSTPRPARLAGARRHRRRSPTPALPDGLELPEAGEAAAAPALAGVRRASGSPTTTTSATAPTSTPPRTMSVHLKWGEIHPRTMLADLAGRTRPGRRDLPQGARLAGVLRRRAVPRARRPRATTSAPSSRGWRTTSRATSSTPGSEGRTGFPIVDAGMRQLRADRLDAQPGADDRGELPGQGPARRVAARRAALHAAGSSTATSPPTSTAGSGSAGCGTDAAPYFRVFNPTTQGREVRPRRRLRPALGARARRRADASTSTSRRRPDGVPDGYPAPIVDHAEERREALDRYERIKTMTEPTSLVPGPLLRAGRSGNGGWTPARWPSWSRRPTTGAGRGRRGHPAPAAAAGHP